MKLKDRLCAIKIVDAHIRIFLLGIKLSVPVVNFPVFRLFYKRLAVQPNKIVFANFKGGGYGCNPKYIAEEILRRKLPYKIVWLIKNSNRKKTTFPPEIELCSWNNMRALKELATAKIWVDNQRKNFHIRNGLQKKPGQVYINTWHGSLGIKKIGVESNVTDTSWTQFGMVDADMLDYILSNSTFEDDVFRRNFWNKGKILQLGHARNDVFFKDPLPYKQKVCEKYGIDQATRIMLYVPSYRDDKRIDCYDVDYAALKKTLEQKFSGNWMIMVRLHPNAAKFQNILPQQDYIINATDYPDIQELLVASDAALTDYSSCIFDFMLSRKPAFIFATDIKEYDTERGFYYPLTSTPFPVAENNEQLCNNIMNFELAPYQNKVEEFLTGKGCMEDGHAAERAVDLIEQIMRGEM